MRGGSEETVARLDEGEWVAFWIFEREAQRTGFVLSDRAGFDFVGQEIFSHLREVRRGESDLGEEIVGRATGDLLEFDALVAVDGVARVGDAEAGGGGGVEAENFGVEGAGGVEVRSAKADGRDPRDFGASERLRLDVRSFLNAEDAEST